jgi:hypothetical protein
MQRAAKCLARTVEVATLTLAREMLHYTLHCRLFKASCNETHFLFHRHVVDIEHLTIIG